jgi:hypothetical protein
MPLVQMAKLVVVNMYIDCCNPYLTYIFIDIINHVDYLFSYNVV